MFAVWLVFVVVMGGFDCCFWWAVAGGLVVVVCVWFACGSAIAAGLLLVGLLV